MSGTTARPKGVEITHRNIWVNAVTFGLHTTISDRDVYLHTLPMFHANAWVIAFARPAAGTRRVVLVTSDDRIHLDHGPRDAALLVVAEVPS